MKKITATLKKLIALLNNGEFHSGNALGEALSISRNAVWKNINQLIKYGVPIESAQSKGYRLATPLILLNEKEIQKNLKKHSRFSPSKIELWGSIPSTNDQVKFSNNKLSSQELIFCLAEHQSGGKGRLGRTWHSPFGQNIYLSCAWNISSDISKLSGLSLVIALSVHQALLHHGVTDISVKWPNDILWREKKLAGILTEISAEANGNAQVIIGIGININMNNASKQNINRSWTSLSQILKKTQNRNLIVTNVINILIENIVQFEKNGLESFMEKWQQHDQLIGKEITLSVGKNNVKGLIKGINTLGHLILEEKNGVLNTYSAGEVSISAAE